MTAQTKYITSIIKTFSTYLESLDISQKLSDEATSQLINFLKQKKNYDSWSMTELEKFVKTEKISSNTAVLIRKFIKDFTPHQVDVFLHQFLSSLKDEQKSKSTIKNYKSDISQLISLVGVNKIANLFTQANIKRFVKQQFGKNLKASTVKRKLTSIAQFAIWTEDQKLVENISFWISDVENLFKSQGKKVVGVGIADANSTHKELKNQKTTSEEVEFGKPVGLPFCKTDNLNNILAKNSNLSSINPDRGDVEIGGIEPPKHRLSVLQGKPAIPTSSVNISQNKRQIKPKSATALLEEFLVNLKISGSSKSTIKNYKSDISQLINFVGEKLGDNASLSTIITQDNLKKFLEYQKVKGLKPKSVQRKTVSISQFSIWAEEKGALEGTTLWIKNLSTGKIGAGPSTDKSSIEIPDSKPVRIVGADHSIELKLRDKTQDKSQAKTQNKIQPPVKAKREGWSLPMSKFIKDKSKDNLKNGETKNGTTGYKVNREAREDALGYKSRLKESLKEFSSSINTNKKKTFLPYFNLAMIVLFILGIGYFGYQQFIKQTPGSLAYPTTPTRPNRELSFQGRLTDTAQNPVTTATNMAFRLYDDLSAGSLLWDSSTCSVTPDQDGIFNVGLGDDCGSEISENVFTENSNVWLEVDVAAETLTPRQSIKTVAYALNAETVQGYPVSATGAATTNTILVMDAGGQVVLGEVSPTFKSTTGTFSIEAQALTLQTSSGSNGDIILDPDGLGEVLSTGYFSAPGATFSATYAGGTSLVLKGGPSGTGNIQENQDSSGNVLSGVDERGVLFSDGDTDVSNVFIGNDAGTTTSDGVQNVAIGSNALNSLSASSGGDNNFALGFNALTAVTTGGFNIGIGTSTGNQITTKSGSIMLGYQTMVFGGGEYNTSIGHQSSLYQHGGYNVAIGYQAGFNSNASNNIFIGSTAGYRQTTNSNLLIIDNQQRADAATETTNSILYGVMASTPGSQTLRINAVPSINGAYTLPIVDGTANYILQTDGSGAATWVDPALAAAGSIYWTSSLGSLYPKNSTMDVFFGGQASSSANFAFLNNDSGTPTASISGNLVLNSAGTIQTTNDQLLTIGGNTTGSIFLDGNVGVGTNAPGAKLIVEDSSAGSLRIANFENTSTGAGFIEITGNSKTSQITTGQGGALIFSTDATAGTFGNERMRITSAGYLGITETSPISTLSIGAGSDTAVTDGTTDVSTLGLNLSIIDAADYAVGILNSHVSGDGLLIQAGDASDDYALRIEDYDSANDLLVVRGDGKVGIGTSSPGTLLHLQDATAGVLKIETTGVNSNASIQYTNDAHTWQTFVDGTQSDGFAIRDTLRPETYLFITTAGLVNIGTGPGTARFQVTGRADTVQQIIKANGTQTNNLLEIQDSSGNVLSGADERGILFSDGNSVATNFFAGINAGNVAASGGNNTFIGNSTGKDISTGLGNIAMGYTAAYVLTEGNYNLLFGYQSGFNATTSDYNVGIGYQSLYGDGTSKLTGDNNVGLGRRAGYGLSSGSSNIFIGAFSGDKQTTLSNLLIIDNQERADVATELTNSILYGVMASTPGSQTLRINAVPSINGAYTLPIVDGTANYILQTDGSGAATWVDPAGASADSIYWTVSNGSLYPKNSTMDVFFGGQASSSANFAFLNNDSGTPTASISGNLVLNSAGTIQTTNDQLLTIGGNTTGSIFLDGNVGVGTSAPLDILHVVDSTDAVASIRRSSTGTGDLVGLQLGVTTATTDDVYRAGIIGERRADGNLDLHLATATSGNINASDARLTILSTGYVGISETSPASTLSLGAGSDTLVTDGTTASSVLGLNISISDDSAYAAGIYNSNVSGDGLLIQAGDASDDYALRIEDYDSANNLLTVRGDGWVGIGDVLNTNMTQGLTINQGANDNEIFALKSSDVGHPMTGQAEADTYGAFSKFSGGAGGLHIRGYKDADDTSNQALVLQGTLGEAANTGKSTSADGVIRILANITNGVTGVTDIGTDGNLLSIANNETTRFIFDAEGTMHQLTGDNDLDLLTLSGTTGTPTLSWDESEDNFSMNKGLIVTESAPTAWLKDTAGTAPSALSRTMAGLQLSSVGMNATSKYTPAIKFMSTDASFSTENPKLLAAIAGRATQAYSGDTTGGMAIDFATTPDTPGATNVPVVTMTLDQSGSLFIGDTANTKMTQGLTINQGANDDEIFALKSSDVAHGMTGIAEADTYGAFAKQGATAGGLEITGLRDADGTPRSALTLQGLLGEAASTNKTTGAGLVDIRAAITDGATNIADVGADGNLFSIANNVTIKLIIDAEGTIHQIPGSDIDIDLLTVQVTGTPTLSWDESRDAFDLSKGLIVNSDNGFLGVGATAVSSADRLIDLDDTLVSANSYGVVNTPTFGSGATTAYGYYNRNTVDDGVALTSSYGLTISDAVLGAGASITNQYGIWLDSFNSATNNYSIYTNAGSNMFNAGGDANTDFTVQGDTDADLLFVDAGNDIVQLGKLSINGAFTFPTADGTTDYVLKTDGSGTLSWTAQSGGGGSSLWRITDGAISPINDTLDLLIGSTASTSAKFAFLNVDSGTPTASISGNIVLNAAGLIQTTENQLLTLGGDTTGSIFLDGNVGIGTSAPTTPLQINQDADSSGITICGYDDLSALCTKIHLNSSAITELDFYNTAYIIADSATVAHILSDRIEIQDNKFIDFGNHNDFRITYDETTDDRLEITDISGNMFLSIKDQGTTADFAFNTNDLFVDNTGKVGIGTTTPLGLLNVEGATTGKALAIFNETGDQDIITASASGVTKFRVANDGYVYGERFVDNTNSTYYVDPAAGDYAAYLAGDIWANGGDLTLAPQASTSRTDEGNIYYDSDNDHLFLYSNYDGTGLAYRRLAMDMTQYSSNNAALADGSYVEIAHNQATNDIQSTGWIYDGAKYIEINDMASGHNTFDPQLVAWWKMEESSGNLDNAEGTAANDLVASGSATYAQTGKIQDSIDFDGSTDWFTTTNDADNDNFDFGTGSFSIGGWFKHDTISTNEDYLVTKYSDAAAVDVGDGTDGAITISSSTDINAISSGSHSCADGGDAVNYSITTLTSTVATLSTTPSAGCIVAGDEILIINQQGTGSNFSNVGNYETLSVGSVSSNEITFTTSKSNYYGDASNDTNIGTASTNQRVMLQRVPNYTTVTVNSSQNFTPTAWNGTKNGVMFFRATGTVTIAGNIHADELGYDGIFDNDPDNRVNYDSWGGDGGESICGIGGVNNTAYNTIGYDGAAGGGAGETLEGGNGSCGGGGGSMVSSAPTRGQGSSGSGGSGGGGAGYGGAGGGGGYGGAGEGGGKDYGTYEGQDGGTDYSGDSGYGHTNAYAGGGGGGTYGSSDLTTLFFGSAGGEGAEMNSTQAGRSGTWSGKGGDSGGIVMIAADVINVSGSISTDGENGGDGRSGSDYYNGGGGGGAGGSILLQTDTLTGGALITSTGGARSTGYQAGADAGSIGEGGAAGVGRIRMEYITSVSGTSSPIASTSQVSADSGGYKLYMDSDGDMFFDIDDDKDSFPEDSAGTVGANYDDNLWHHVTAVKDGISAIKIYVDGQEVASDYTLSSTASISNSNPFYLGVDSDGASNSWDGTLDEMFVYGRSLSPGEIEELYQANSEFYIEQTDNNTVRLYNYSGAAQDIRLDVITHGADLAEWYTVDDQDIEAGDIVALTGNLDKYGVPILTKAKYDNLSNLTGAISTKASQELGIEADNRRLLGLAGRIPIKIDPASPPIKAGQYITASPNIPGFGFKADMGDIVIAKALEDWDPNDGNEVVLSFITDPQVNPLNTKDSLSSLIITKISDAYFQITNALTDSIIEPVTALASAMIGNLEAGYIDAQKIVTEDLTIGGQEIADYITSVVQLAMNSGELVSPILESDPTDGITINIASESSSIVIKDITNTTVAEISNSGDLTLLGSLTTDSIQTNTLLSNHLQTSVATISGSLVVNGSATIDGDASTSGTLIANKIETTSARISALEAGIAQLENIKATTAEIVTATVSGTLYADNIYANSIYDLEEKVLTALQKPNLLDIITGANESTVSATQMAELYDTVNTSQFEAIAMTDLDLSINELPLTANDIVLTGSALFIEKYFKVNGAGYISDSLAVGNSIFANNSIIVGNGNSTTQISNGFIAYTSENPDSQILRIQPEGQGSIQLLAGLVTLDSSGLATINGDLETTGNVKVGKTLLADLIQPTDFGNPLQVQVAGIDAQTGEIKESRFEIINEAGSPVATFSAQGRAEFAGGIGIASQDLGSSLTNELSADKTSGKATIKSGASEVKIKTSLINDKTLIYITAVGSTGNQVLYLKSQLPNITSSTQDTSSSTTIETTTQEGEFIVGFDNPTTADVSFNWWIVN